MDTWEPDVLAALNGVGPNSDGTYGIPSAAVMPQPVDAGGGPPANYSGQILDLFKFGVGVWQQADARQDMLDYRRWESTNAGLYQQGQAAAIYGSRNQVGILGIAAVGLILFLALKD